MDCSPPGSSARGILPSPGDLPDPRIGPTSLMSPALAGGFFTTGANWEAQGGYSLMTEKIPAGKVID